MEVTKTICAAVLLTTIVLTASVKANEVDTIVKGDKPIEIDRSISTLDLVVSDGKYPAKGKYDSNYYRIEITEGGDYLSYDREGRKLVIFSNYLTTKGKTAEWRYQGYVYRIYEPSSRSDRSDRRSPMIFQDPTVREKTMLTITDPQGNEIFHEQIYPGQWPVDWDIYGGYNLVD
jgi:hypothetical protein